MSDSAGGVVKVAKVGVDVNDIISLADTTPATIAR